MMDVASAGSVKVTSHVPLGLRVVERGSVTEEWLDLTIALPETVLAGGTPSALILMVKVHG